MTMTYRIAARLLNRPLLLLPSAAQANATALADRIGIEPPELLDGVERPEPSTSRFVGEGVYDQGRYRIADGIAIITVAGELVNRGAWIGASSGLVSYEGLAANIAAAGSDDRVRAVVLDVDSPGGEASGAMELARDVPRLANGKPVWGFANAMAASAAYALVSHGQRTVTMPSALTGSIGVVMLHLDVSGELEMKGRRPTLLFAGAHKVDGHPFGPLPETVQADLQREVEQFYQDFVSTVAEGRTGLDEAAVRATEARIFKGQDAVDVGLADQVGTLDDVLSGLQASLRRTYPAGAGPTSKVKGKQMTETNDVAGGAEATVTMAEHDAAVAAAHAEAHAEGARQATDRIRAILNLEEAAGREAQARVIALDTEVTPEAAQSMLAAGAKGESIPSIEDRDAGSPDAGFDANGGGKDESGLHRLVTKRVERMTATR